MMQQIPPSLLEDMMENMLVRLNSFSGCIAFDSISLTAPRQNTFAYDSLTNNLHCQLTNLPHL